MNTTTKTTSQRETDQEMYWNVTTDPHNARWVEQLPFADWLEAVAPFYEGHVGPAVANRLRRLMSKELAAQDALTIPINGGRRAKSAEASELLGDTRTAFNRAIRDFREEL